MGKLQENKLTQLSLTEGAEALNDAMFKMYGSKPSDNTLAILWAQTVLETARYKKIHCYNFGNIKKVYKPDDGHDWCMFRCSEIIRGKEYWFDPPHPQTHFRAYNSAEDGALDYLKLISKKTRYQKAWSALLKGDPVNYSKQLKLAGYYTASESLYTKGVVALTNEFLNKVLPTLKNKQKLEDDVLLSEKKFLELTDQTTEQMLDSYFKSNRYDLNEEKNETLTYKPWWKFW